MWLSAKHLWLYNNIHAQFFHLCGAFRVYFLTTARAKTSTRHSLMHFLYGAARNYPEGIARFSALAAPFAFYLRCLRLWAEELISRAFRIIMRIMHTGQPPQNNIQPPGSLSGEKQAKLVLDFYCCRMITEKKKGGSFLVFSNRDNPFTLSRRYYLFCPWMLHYYVCKHPAALSHNKQERRATVATCSTQPLCESDLFMKMGIKGVKFYYFTWIFYLDAASNDPVFILYFECQRLKKRGRRDVH